MERIFRQLLDDMGMHAHADYPRECCGLITKDYKYIACDNISMDPKNSFVLDPVKLLEYEDNCWGIFHSHPGDENPIPSEHDMQSTVFDEYKFIVGFNDKFFIYWFDKKLEILRYEPFEERHLN